MIQMETCAVARHAIVLALLVCAIRISATGQDVSLEVKTRGGRTEFHVGEVIQLDLAFTAHTSDRYRLISGGTFPERYPLQDTFRVEPVRGWEDPLADYRRALYKAETNGSDPSQID
jgi:hypothetical protein